MRQRLRYRFDNLMARGAGPQIAVLALLSLVIVVITAAVIVLGGFAQDDKGDSPPFIMLVWRSFMHEIDTGNLGGDNGGWPFLLLMLFATLGGIFVLSAFIGILNTFLSERLANLRKGRSLVVENGHTVILGWTPKVHTLLSELAEANANKPKACVVILADVDKATMDDEVRTRLPRKMKVVTRTGDPMSVRDLEIVNLPGAKSIIVMSPERDDKGEPLPPHHADTIVLKTLLAVGKLQPDGGRFHVVAELQDEKILAVARMVVGEEAALLLGPPLVSRLLVHTGRFSGLSAVFTELLDFGGSEIYIQPEPKLVGRTFREALALYDDSAPIGVLTAGNQLLLPPKFNYALAPGDQIIAISEDDDTVIVNGRPTPIREELLATEEPPPKKRAEKQLILGTNERLGLVLRELAPYAALGSQTLVVGENGTLGEAVAAATRTLFPHLNATFRRGDMSDRALLDALNVTSYEHILVLAESAGRSHDVADARTMVTLLHLRDIMRRAGKSVPVTTEILDVQNRELAAVAEADDFVVSNNLVALMVAQLSENEHLVRVFDELLTYGGHDLRIRPAATYVAPGSDVDMYQVVEAAARRNEVFIGYRLAVHAKDPTRQFGVVVNPTKHVRLTLDPADQIIVLTQV
ncbi:MAG TPA: hypothetical protein VKE22_27960 [Haliangiales bacterium]|nr:hypothetical protein [Haliangiales bacterium]